MPNAALEALDAVDLNLSTGSLTAVNFTLGFVMFGVAIGIDTEDFKAIVKRPKSVWVGLTGQWLVLPALTLLMILALDQYITAGVAMGLILVASCPGGNISNFMVHLAKGNSALSVGLTAFSTLGSIFLTPLTFWGWGSLYTHFTSNADNPLLQQLSMDPIEVGKSVFLLLGLPLLLGMALRKYQPKLVAKLHAPMRWLSILAFLTILGVAFSKNIDLFLQFIGAIFFIVLAHNSMVLLAGYNWGRLWGVPQRDRRSISIEMGIQNTGLGLVLLLNPSIFPSELTIGGMAAITAWWGIWHIPSGLTVATYWRNRKLKVE
ncbi:MAG: bile acid:sodium symporter family protein [Flavobacteriia bacterium]|nr:bile acid:sodium symporter family protein [Flavobacteriia bacterium]